MTPAETAAAPASAAAGADADRAADAQVRAALALRAWALPFLLGGGAPEPPPLDVGPEAWALFLASERVALPVQKRLEAAGFLMVLAPAAVEVLRERGLRELQRVLSARAQLRLLGDLLRERGWRGIALKGGAAALAGEPLDLADVDVLVPPEHAETIARELAARSGAAPHGSASVAHLTPLAAPDAVGVEVHFAVPYLEPGEAWETPLPTDEPALCVLAPPLQLWQVLAHAADAHLDRRGSLRDLLLARAALDASPPGGLPQVEARIGRHRAAAALRAMLAMARGDSAAGDPFRAVAALGYLLRARPVERPLRFAASSALALSAYALAAGDGEYRALWGRRAYGAVFGWEEGSGSFLRRVPPVARLGRAGWRAAHFAAAAPLALRLARRARRLASEAKVG